MSLSLDCRLCEGRDLLTLFAISLVCSQDSVGHSVERMSSTAVGKTGFPGTRADPAPQDFPHKIGSSYPSSSSKAQVLPMTLLGVADFPGSFPHTFGFLVTIPVSLFMAETSS